MMPTPEMRNAKITAVSISQKHFLSSWLTLDYGGAGQGFGGYALGGEATTLWIKGILNALDVEKWENLPGTVIRVVQDHGKVYRIGHALKDQWFDPEVAFAPLRKESTRAPA